MEDHPTSKTDCRMNEAISNCSDAAGRSFSASSSSSSSYSPLPPFSYHLCIGQRKQMAKKIEKILTDNGWYIGYYTWVESIEKVA